MAASAMGEGPGEPGARVGEQPDHPILDARVRDHRGFSVLAGTLVIGAIFVFLTLGSLIEGREILVAASGERGPLAVDAARALAVLYAHRDEADPDGGHAAEAERWRAVVDALETSE